MARYGAHWRLSLSLSLSRLHPQSILLRTVDTAPFKCQGGLISYFPIFMIHNYFCFLFVMFPELRFSFYVLTYHLLVELPTLNIALYGRKPTISIFSFIIFF